MRVTSIDVCVDPSRKLVRGAPCARSGFGSIRGYAASVNACLMPLRDLLRRAGFDFAPTCCLSFTKVPADCRQVVVELGSVLFPIVADGLRYLPPHTPEHPGADWRTGRKIVYRILVWNPWQESFFRLVGPLRTLQYGWLHALEAGVRMLRSATTSNRQG